MQSDLFATMTISAAGMQVQGARMRVISENIANSDTAAGTPNEDPYRRQTITFKNAMDREAGMKLVQVDDIGNDMDADFRLKFMPDHPGADETGYVRTPNVNTLIEMTNMREAQRSYEANLGMIEQARTMMMRTIDILRA